MPVDKNGDKLSETGDKLSDMLSSPVVSRYLIDVQYQSFLRVRAHAFAVVSCRSVADFGGVFPVFVRELLCGRARISELFPQ